MATNPFGDEEAGTPTIGGANPFGDMEVVSGPSPLEAEAPGVMGKLGQSFTAAVPAFKGRVAGGEQAILEMGGTPVNALTDINLVQPAPTVESVAREKVVAKRKGFEAEAKALRPDVSGEGLVMQEVLNAPENLATSLASLGVGLATKSPALGLASFGMLAVGGGYAEARDAGKAPESALRYGLTEGAIEVGTESLPMLSALKTLTKNTGLGKVAAEFFGREVLGEQAATLLGDLNQWMSLNPDKTIEQFLKERPEAAARTLVSTIASGGVQTGALYGVGKGAEVLGKRIERNEELQRAKEKVAEDLSGVITPDNGSEYAPATPPADGMGITPQPNATDAMVMGLPSNLPPSYAIPAAPDDTPLTSAELILAAQQELTLKTGVSHVPENPDPLVQAQVESLNAALTNPVFVEQGIEDAVQERIVEMRDEDPLISPEVAERRARDEFPQSIPPDQRLISWSSEDGVAGLTPRQAPVQPAGSVRLLGWNDEQFSPELRSSMGETLQGWVHRFLDPNAKVIVNLSGMANEAVGVYQQLPDGTHVISPRELVRTARAEEGAGLNQYNQFTQVQFYGALTHEFGHAVVMSQFFKGIPAGYEDLRQNLNRTDAGVYTNEQLAALPEAQGQVIREFYARKAAVLSGQMTAKELVDTWSGTWKVGKDLMKTKNLQSIYAMGRKALQDAGYTLSGNPTDLKTSEGASISANELLEALSGGDPKKKEYYLSFEEYMAEQFTRYAHMKKIDEGTALGRYFKMALDTLRNFFRQMKVEGIIQPGVEFTAWLDEVVKTRAEQAAEALKVKPKKARAKKVKVSQEALIQEVVQNNVQHPTALEDLANDPEAQGRMRERIRNTFPPMIARTAQEKKLAKAALEAIAQGNELEFEDILREYEGLKPRFDVKGKGGAWSEGAARVLMQSFANQLLPHTTEAGGKSLRDWSLRIGQNYLNKYAGQATDPIKAIEVQAGLSIENVLDSTVSELVVEGTGYTEWNFHVQPRQRLSYLLRPLTDYLQHAADYLIGNAPQEKWQNYDLVRLVKETAKWDAEMAAKASVPMLERLAPLPVYTLYPDGFRWIELPKSDTPEGLQLIQDVGVLGKWCTQDLKNAKNYSNKANTLYVLESPEGDVHAQVLVENGTDIRQFKGKANQALKPEYLAYAHDFVKNREVPFEYVGDLNYIGLVSLKDEAPTQKILEQLREAMPDTSNYQTSEVVDAVLNPLLFAQRGNAIAWFQSGKGLTVYKGWALDSVVQVLRSATPDNFVYEARRLVTNALRAMSSYEDLRFDKDAPAEDIENARISDTALRKLGAQGTAARWASKAINFVSNAQHYVLQLQQLAYTETNPGLRAMVRYITEMNALKNNMMAKAVDISKGWEGLSARGATQLEKAISDEYFSEGHVTELVQEGGVWVHRAGIGLDNFLAQRGVDLASEEGAEIRQLFLDYKNSILSHINLIELSAITMIRERYQKAPLVVRKKIAEIREASHEWRKAPYMPRGHFGNFIVKVYAKNPETGRRELVHLEHFENSTDQDIAVKVLQGRYPAKDIRPSHIDDTERMYLSMPSDFLMTLSDSGNFSDDQIVAIGEAMIPIRTPKMFKVFARDASKVAGAEPDVLRNYANWVEDNANATAKFIYTRRITQAIAWTRSDMNELNRAGNVQGYRKLQRIYETMQRAKGYTLHPKAEWFKARNYISLAYLMWAPKTALMNLSGLLLTWAGVTAEHGDLRGNHMFVKTMKDLSIGKLTKDDMWVLDRATQDGLLDQGFGYFMAGLANSGNLARRIRKNSLGKLQRFFVEGGMAPFTAVEKVNRKMTLLPFFRLEYEKAVKRGLIPEQARIYAYELATSKTRKLQNDYAAGNRPPLFQGKQSLFMIFYSFPQYMLWVMSGGYERGVRLELKARGETPRTWLGGTTMRMWLIFLFLAGTEGVPFGEFTQKILQWLWNKFGGGENLQIEAQRFMKDVVGIESSYWRNVVQRGLLHDVNLGAGHVDLSGSYSMGTPLPLTKLEGLPDNANELIGTIFKELTGPFGGVTSGAAGLLGADEIGVKELSRALPGEAGSLARAFQASETGLVNTRGAMVLRDEGGKVREVTTGEIVLKGLGFTLRDETEAREFRNVRKQMSDYWSERRQGLQRDYSEARKLLDRQAILDVQAAVREYNSEIPNRDLWLSTKELNEGFHTKRKAISREEREVVTRRERGLAKDIRSVMGSD